MVMNLYLGGFAGTDGGWSWATQFRIFLKTGELIPSPAKIFVFLDMRTDLVGWPNFMTDMTGYPSSPAAYRFSDFPGFAHNTSCGFSFGDGHAEMRRWRDPRTTPVAPPYYSTVSSPGNPDIAWLQDHATRPK